MSIFFPILISFNSEAKISYIENCSSYEENLKYIEMRIRMAENQQFIFSQFVMSLKFQICMYSQFPLYIDRQNAAWGEMKQDENDFN
jgi:hypothetical protein